MFAGIFILVAALVTSGSYAMSRTENERTVRCTVVGGDKLATQLGGTELVCHTIERAIAARTPTRDYRVEVKIISPSRLSAQLMVQGRLLPEQRFAVMDRKLSSSSIQHFADSLAGLVAEADKQ
jgi:hypothetical protein